MSKAAELAALIGSQTALSNRNLIINGAMQVAQYGTSSTGNTSGGFKTVDRFPVQTAGRDQHIYTAEQVSDAPAGFTSSFKLTTTTAESAIDANDAFWFAQKIEAQNLQHLQNGLSGAKRVTLSFYVKSSQTGTFGVNLYKPDNTARIINASYTISSANTWEYKTVTFAGDTSGGGIDNDNGEGLRVTWTLAAGSDFDSVNSTSWANYTVTNWAGSHAQDGVITTANATWQITGVQLEIGDQATAFEHRPFGDELARCQRYYYESGGTATNDWGQKGYQSANNFSANTLQHPVAMRAAPIGTKVGSFILSNCNAPSIIGTSTIAYQWQMQKNSATGPWSMYSNSSGKFTFNAEL
tara:strand:+ start:414 stop:1475 length:1062 start_codon:yes stop_codon:yes gene_type:complete